MGALSKGPDPRGSIRELLRLSCSTGWGPARIREGLERQSSVTSLLAAASRKGELASTARVDEILSVCRDSGTTVTGLDGSAYPDSLRHLHDPPPVLFSRGDMSALNAPRLVVVGSRQATAYGRRVAEVLAGTAARAGWLVLSGLALGIDGAAHRGALAAGGVTAAVLGSGPDRPTPRAHARLADELLMCGCVLSELPPGVPARPHHFPRRNRILAALGERVVVVEAARRSGALITARLALELGREVWAVPGPVFSPVCEGTHLLLEDGARPVVSPDHWRESLWGRAGGGASQGPSPELRQSWDPATQGVWAALAGDPCTLDNLVEQVGRSATEVLAALTTLELGGWVWRGPGGAFQRRAA